MKEYCKICKNKAKHSLYGEVCMFSGKAPYYKGENCDKFERNPDLIEPASEASDENNNKTTDPAKPFALGFFFFFVFQIFIIPIYLSFTYNISVSKIIGNLDWAVIFGRSIGAGIVFYLGARFNNRNKD